MGAPFWDNTEGATYVFTEPQAGWSSYSTSSDAYDKLTTPGGQPNENYRFGNSVSLSGTTLVVGAENWIGYRCYPCQFGAAFLYSLASGTPSYEQMLSDPAATESDDFGSSVAVDGSTLVVGSAGFDSQQGAAYVYTLSGGSATETQRLTAADGAANEEFGFTVAVSGATILAGEPKLAGSSSGSAYVFQPTVVSSPSPLPQGVITDGVGAPYTGPGGTPVTLTANSVACTSVSPCTWSATPGLPAGLTLSSTGSDDGKTTTITGTPSAVQTVTGTITVSQGGVSQQELPFVLSDIENFDSSGGIGADPTGMLAVSNSTADSGGNVFVAATKGGASGTGEVDEIDAAANPISAGSTAAIGGLSNLLDYPVDLGYENATSTLFAANFVGSDLAQVSAPFATATGTADPLPGCEQEEGVSPDSSGSGDVWIACYGAGSEGKVAVWEPTTNGESALFPLTSGDSAPSGVAPDGTPGDVVVADTTAGTLSTVDATGVVTPTGGATSASATLPSGSLPAEVAYANVGGTGPTNGTNFDYVADPGTGEFSVVDESTDSDPQDVADIALPAPVGSNPPEPYGIATDGSSTLIVSDANNACAYVYTLNDGQNVSAGQTPYATLDYRVDLPASAVPDGVADLASVPGTDPTSANLAFIGDEAGNQVTVVDPPVAAAGSRSLGDVPPVTIGSTVGTPVGTGVSPAANAAAGNLLAPVPAAKKTTKPKAKHAKRRKKHKKKRARIERKSKQTTHHRTKRARR